jgi:hypothetical protein
MIDSYRHEPIRIDMASRAGIPALMLFLAEEDESGFIVGGESADHHHFVLAGEEGE